MASLTPKSRSLFTRLRQSARLRLSSPSSNTFSPSELIKMICSNPNILSASLNERIIPNLSLLEAAFDSKARVIEAISRGSLLLSQKLEKHMTPNLEILRENSRPAEMIFRLCRIFPRVIVKDPTSIIKTVNTLKGLGMSPSKLAFIHGMNVIASYKKETWERKIELFRSVGWSEEDTLSTFSRYPTCISSSEDRITKAFKFFEEKLQWDSAMVLRWPSVLMYSLHGRIIPRCAVLDVLAKNGLWNGTPTVRSLLPMAEKVFKERFVDKYEEELPQVIDAYQSKIEFTGFEKSIVQKSIIRNQPEAWWCLTTSESF